MDSLRLQPVLHIVPVMSLCVFLATSTPVSSAESATSPAAGGMLIPILITMLAAIALSALAIIGLVYWVRKQQHIHDMMLFCMKYLVNSEDEAERCAAARALGRTNDSGAILVLINVLWDENDTETVRKAAGEALHEMSVRYRKHRTIIADLELEAEQKNYSGIIGILIANFEQGEVRYVQSAYTIGRHYMRLELYADAWSWLVKAESRNRKFYLYGDRIRDWIQVCTTRLLKEADDAFKAADYQQAREHYAALAHCLSDADSRRCAVYLRSACVYCKLKDYRDADQALLQALAHNHEPDLALTLVPLLQGMVIQDDKNVEPNDKLEESKDAIDECAGSIMGVLLERNL